jgi:hypothetical protein
MLVELGIWSRPSASAVSIGPVLPGGSHLVGGFLPRSFLGPSWVYRQFVAAVRDETVLETVLADQVGGQADARELPIWARKVRASS